MSEQLYFLKHLKASNTSSRQINVVVFDVFNQILKKEDFFLTVLPAKTPLNDPLELIHLSTRLFMKEVNL